MTKAEVIAAIADKTGIDKENVSLSLEAFFKVVQKSMEQGESIYIRGFGSFTNKKRAKKIGRNIAKNTAIVIDEHYVPSFKPSKSFIARIKKSEYLRKKLQEKSVLNHNHVSEGENTDAVSSPSMAVQENNQAIHTPENNTPEQIINKTEDNA